MTAQKNKKVTLLALSAVIIIVLAIFIVRVVGLGQEYKHSDRLLMMQPPLEATVPSLVSTQGYNFTQKDFEGHWSLLFFGFTRCPDICPTTLAVLSTAYKTALSRSSGEHIAPLKVYFVSIDAKNDTQEVMQQYVSAFHPDFMGLTGRDQRITDFKKQFGIYSGETDGQITHSESIIILNPKGEWAGVMTPPHFTEEMIDNLIYLMHQK